MQAQSITPTEAQLRHWYETERQTTRAIASRLHMGRKALRALFHTYGIVTRPSGCGLANRGIDPPTRADLQRFVHQERRTQKEIAAMFGVDQTLIHLWLDKHGIPRHRTGHTL